MTVFNKECFLLQTISRESDNLLESLHQIFYERYMLCDFKINLILEPESCKAKWADFYLINTMVLTGTLRLKKGNRQQKVGFSVM